MIDTKESLIGNITQSGELSGIVNKDVQVIEPTLQEKETTPTQSIQTILPDENYDGLSSVVVNPIPNEYIIPSGTLEIESNGNYNVRDYNQANVNIPSGGGVDLGDYITLNATNTSNSSNYWWEAKFAQSKMSLAEITIGSNETGIAYMFDGCKWQYLPKLKGSKNYSSSFNMNYTFYNCTYVQSLDLSGITAKLSRLNYTFMGCNNLTFLDVRNMDFTALTPSASFNSVPTNCLIIVKDATQKAWFNEKFSTLTNVKTVAEYENQ